MATIIICEKCDYKTKENKKLYKHIISVHGYTCKECDFTTVFKRDLQRHIILIHREKSLICTQCNYKADNSDALHLHFKHQHSKVNFQCIHCQYYTKWRINLFKHIKKYHPKKFVKWLIFFSEWTVNLSNHEMFPKMEEPIPVGSFIKSPLDKLLLLPHTTNELIIPFTGKTTYTMS